MAFPYCLVAALRADFFFAADGHVVDLQLDAQGAREKLQDMIQGRWTDESTRALAVDINTYNPTYDMATVFRFQIERDVGGRVWAMVSAHSCALDLYDRPVRSVLEGLWILAFLFYVVDAAMTWCRQGTRAYLGSGWGRADIISLLSFLAVIVCWLDYRMRDTSAFKLQHRDEFKDLYTVCSSSNNQTGFAAFAVVLAFVHVLKFFRVYSPFLMIWQVFVKSLRLLQCFAVVMMLGIFAFLLSGNWLFGTRVYAFCTWPSTLGFLVQSMIAGFVTMQNGETQKVNLQMEEAKEGVARLWTMVWVLVSELIIFNMFVAILVSSFGSVSNRTKHCQHLEKQYPVRPWGFFFKSKCICIVRDPDAREPIHDMVRQVKAWGGCFKKVDRGKLEAVALDAAARGATDFEAKDAMQLFPHSNETESLRRAAAWMRELSKLTGQKVHHAASPPSSADEIKKLMERLASLEEEAMGLTLQVKGVLTQGSHDPSAMAI